MGPNSINHSKPNFVVPGITICPGDKATLWRYMDIPRLISILENRTLYFCPSNQLGDPLEGSLTIWQQIKRSQEQGQSKTLTEILEQSDPDMEKQRQDFFVNCWHISLHESNAMWQIYSHLNKGVAIRSTVGRLKRSLTGFNSSVVIGSIDYSEKIVNYEHMLTRLFLKRKSFAYEKEFRAVIGGKPADGSTGIVVPVDPDELILSVHLSPFCEKWVDDLVRQLLRRYGYRCEVMGGNHKIVF